MRGRNHDLLPLRVVNLDAPSLIASLIVSSVGFVAFSYGKSQQRFPQMIIGLVLMIFPYFVPMAWLMIAIAAVLCGVLWLSVRMGL